MGGERLFFFHQFLHLLYKVGFYLGNVMDFINGGTLAERFIHDKMTFTGGRNQHGEELFLCFAVKILRMAQAVAAGFQAADGFLEGFLVVLADAHDFAYRTHLRTQLVFHAFEFFKGPAGELDYHIVSVRHIFVQSPVFSAGDVLQGEAAGQHGGNEGDREAGSLGSQSGGTGGTGIDFDNNDAVGFRIMGKLYVGAADNLNAFNDFISLLLQTLLTFLRNGEHRGGTERIAGMHAEGIDILNKADGDHVVFTVPDNFQLQLFPAENGFFHKNLSHQACLEASCAYCFQLVHVVNESAACAAHGISGTEYYGIAKTIRNGQRLFHAVGNLAAGHFNAQLVHGFFEFDTVFAAFDGIHLDADNLNVIFFQNAGFVQLRAQVQSGLSAQVGQQGVGPFLGDNLLQPFHIQRFDVSNIGCFRIGHNGCRIGINEYDFITQSLECFTCLSA